MASRRSFLKKLALTPVVVALTPNKFTPPADATTPEVAKDVPLSRFSGSIGATGMAGVGRLTQADLENSDYDTLIIGNPHK